MAKTTVAEKEHHIAPPPETTSYQGEHNGHHGHDDHHGPLMHHFDDMGQQRESITIGMWTFLMTEIMMFTGLFFCYAFFRWKFYDAFLLGSQQLNITLGTGNTFVLLASSMTMAMAVHAAQVGNRKSLVGWMIGTLIFGGAFLGIKAVEWTADYDEGLVPKYSWDATGQKWPTTHKAHTTSKEQKKEGLVPKYSWDSTGQLWKTTHESDKAGKQQKVALREGEVYDYKHEKAVSSDHVKMYFMLYFCMTGLHAIHMVAGMIILGIMTVMALNGVFGNGNDQPIEIFGLYWHFVDIVWVFLFPLLYLIAGFHIGGH
ncbi:MAG TPA: cytochrome c oxidase subunit 3 [Abditibacteriaceae bacterium]